MTQIELSLQRLHAQAHRNTPCWSSWLVGMVDNDFQANGTALISSRSKGLAKNALDIQFSFIVFGSLQVRIDPRLFQRKAFSMIMLLWSECPSHRCSLRLSSVRGRKFGQATGRVRNYSSTISTPRRLPLTLTQLSIKLSYWFHSLVIMHKNDQSHCLKWNVFQSGTRAGSPNQEVARSRSRQNDIHLRSHSR
jgi:hypothetical protein